MATSCSPILLTIVLFILFVKGQQQSFSATADDLFVKIESSPGFVNETHFEEFYHLFLGGEPEVPEGFEPPACAEAETVFALHDGDGNALLNSTEFADALLSMMTAKAEPCEIIEPEAPPCKNSARHAWGWGFLATIIICLLSLIGAILWMVTKTLPKLKRILTNAMIAFAVGTLLGDAVLHIMPEMWALHSHSGAKEHGHHEDHHDKWEELKFLWPGLVLLGTILLFYVLELGITWLVGHNHGHTSDLSHPEDEKHALSRSTGWLNLATEVVHNFIDGIAIGVAFSTSNNLGVSTAIAVGAHELPQELADFALLIESGFKVWHALVLNLCASLSALIGVCVGVAAGQRSEEAQKYLLAFAAGGFLYVALVNMLPALPRLSRGKNRIWLIGVQILAAIIGFVILLVIAITEPEDSC